MSTYIDEIQNNRLARIKLHCADSIISNDQSVGPILIFFNSRQHAYNPELMFLACPKYGIVEMMTEPHAIELVTITAVGGIFFHDVKLMLQIIFLYHA